jgi:hypothetical protein
MIEDTRPPEQRTITERHIVHIRMLQMVLDNGTLIQLVPHLNAVSIKYEGQTGVKFYNLKELIVKVDSDLSRL